MNQPSEISQTNAPASNFMEDEIGGELWRFVASEDFPATKRNYNVLAVLVAAKIRSGIFSVAKRPCS